MTYVRRAIPRISLSFLFKGCYSSCICLKGVEKTKGNEDTDKDENRVVSKSSSDRISFLCRRLNEAWNDSVKSGQKFIIIPFCFLFIGCRETRRK